MVFDLDLEQSKDMGKGKDMNLDLENQEFRDQQRNGSLGSSPIDFTNRDASGSALGFAA